MWKNQVSLAETTTPVPSFDNLLDLDESFVDMIETEEFEAEDNKDTNQSTPGQLATVYFQCWTRNINSVADKHGLGHEYAKYRAQANIHLVRLSKCGLFGR